MPCAAARAPSGRTTIQAARGARDRSRNGTTSAAATLVDVRKRVILPARRFLLHEPDAVHVLGPHHAALRGRREYSARLPDDGDEFLDRDLLPGVGQIDLRRRLRIAGNQFAGLVER